MKIKITRTVGGHQVGDTIDLPTSQATYLVTNGYAEASQKADAKKGDTDDEVGPDGGGDEGKAEAPAPRKPRSRKSSAAGKGA